MLKYSPTLIAYSVLMGLIFMKSSPVISLNFWVEHSDKFLSIGFSKFLISYYRVFRSYRITVCLKEDSASSCSQGLLDLCP